MEKKIMPVIIKPAALELLKKSNYTDKTAAAILSIAAGTFTSEENAENANPLVIAAFATINADTIQSFNNKVKAGVVSAQRRASTGPSKPKIEIPALTNSLNLQSKRYGRHEVYASTYLKIRYIMLSRGYDFSEIGIFLNYYLVRMETLQLPVANEAELLDKAQAWDNNGRKRRFSGCESFPDIICAVINLVPIKDRIFFLDNGLKVLTDGKGRYMIEAMPVAIEAFRAHEDIIRKALRDAVSIDFRTHSEFF